MAIDAVGITPNEQGTDIGTTKRIYSSDSAPTMKVAFKTATRKTNNNFGWSKADISVIVDKINKNGSEDYNGYTYQGSASISDIGYATFSYTGSDSAGYVYTYPFSSITGLASLIGTLTYGSRSFDAIRLTITVTCKWQEGNDWKSTSSTQVCYIGFIPFYTLSSVYLDKNGLNITYTASGWNRANDRWAIKQISDVSTYVLNESDDIWGVVGSAGKLTIPNDKLIYRPKNGDTLTGTVRMVGSWMGTGTVLNTLDLSTRTVQDLYTLKKPKFTSVTVVGDGVQITVNQDSTTSGSNLDYIEVSMVGGRFEADRALIPVGGTHTFNAVPYGVTTTWQAIGHSAAAGEDAVSAVVTTTAQAVSGSGLTLTSNEGSLRLSYNVSYNANSRPSVTTAKLAGRDRPSVGFGVGGAVTWTITGTIVTSNLSSNLEQVDERWARSIPMQGVWVMRLPDGDRVQLYITNCGVSMAQGAYGWRTVSISAEEVS